MTTKHTCRWRLPHTHLRGASVPLEKEGTQRHLSTQSQPAVETGHRIFHPLQGQDVYHWASAPFQPRAPDAGQGRESAVHMGFPHLDSICASLHSRATEPQPAFKTFLEPTTSLPFWAPSWAEPPCAPSVLFSWARQYPPPSSQSSRRHPVLGGCSLPLSICQEWACPTVAFAFHLCLRPLQVPHRKVTFGGSIPISRIFPSPAWSFLISC